MSVYSPQSTVSLLPEVRGYSLNSLAKDFVSTGSSFSPTQCLQAKTCRPLDSHDLLKLPIKPPPSKSKLIKIQKIDIPLKESLNFEVKDANIRLICGGLVPFQSSLPHNNHTRVVIIHLEVIRT